MTNHPADRKPAPRECEHVISGERVTMIEKSAYDALERELAEKDKRIAELVGALGNAIDRLTFYDPDHLTIYELEKTLNGTGKGRV